MSLTLISSQNDLQNGSNQDVNWKQKYENLELQHKKILFHLEELFKCTKEYLQIESIPNSMTKTNTKTTYEEYENRPILPRFYIPNEKTNNQTSSWDWENKPIRSAVKNPPSILATRLNLQSYDLNRRRSKSVCFGEDRNSIYELCERSESSMENTKESEKEVTEEPKQEINNQQTNLVTEQLDKIKIDESNEKDKVNKAKAIKQSNSKSKKIVKKITEKNKSDSSDEEFDNSKENKPTEELQKKETNNIKCNCSGDCLTNRCGCKRSLLGCSSKCHNGNSCKNK